jgi:hypothetical protein
MLYVEMPNYDNLALLAPSALEEKGGRSSCTQFIMLIEEQGKEPV